MQNGSLNSQARHPRKVELIHRISRESSRLLQYELQTLWHSVSPAITHARPGPLLLLCGEECPIGSAAVGVHNTLAKPA
jgi:hypothetical protein